MRLLLLSALFILMPLSGCADNSAPSPPPPPSEPAGKERGFHLSQDMNFTALIPYEATEEFRITNGTLTLPGPASKAFYFFRIHEDPSDGFFYYSGYYSQAQERASRLQQNQLTGQRTVECLDAAATPPCPLSTHAMEDLVNDTNWIYRNEPIEAGRGYFVVHAHFDGEFALNLSFDRPVQLAAPQLQAESGLVLTWDQFDATYADVRRCGNIYACGVMIGGRHALAWPSYDWVYSQVLGNFGPGGHLSVCVVTDEIPDCSRYTVVPGLINQGISDRLTRGSTTDVWQVNAFGAGPDGQAAGSFSFWGTMIGFDVPERHPFA